MLTLQNTENSEFGPPTPRSAQSVEHASMHVAVPEIEPARSFHSRAVPNSFMQDEKLIKSSRVEYALRVSKEEIQILSSSGWAAKARRNGDKQESARKIDVRYSSNSGTLRAVLH